MGSTMTSGKDLGKVVKAYLEDNKIIRYFDEITADMEDALGVASRTLKSSTMKHVSSSSLKTYQSDKRALDQSSKNFYDAYNDAINGKDKELKKLQSTYETAVRDLQILEDQNILFGAVVDAGLGLALANFFGPVMVLMEHRKAWNLLKVELANLKADLLQAQKLTAAEGLKTTLGVGITAIGVMTGPVGVGTTIGVAVASHAAGMVIDEVLGAGGSLKPMDMAKDGTLTAMDLASNCENLKGAKGLGPLAAIAGFALDAKDTGAAYLVQKKVQARIKAFDKNFRAATDKLAKQVKELKKLQSDAQKAYDTACRNVGGSSSKSSKRKKPVPMLKKFKPPK